MSNLTREAVAKAFKESLIEVGRLYFSDEDQVRNLDESSKLDPIYEQLSLDSLDHMEIMMSMEEKLQLEILDEKGEKFFEKGATLATVINSVLGEG